MIVREIATPDLKSMIGGATGAKKVDPIVSRRAKIDAGDLKEDKIRARFERLGQVKQYLSRLLLRMLLMTVCLDLMMFRPERAYFFISSVVVFAVCHVACLSRDIINMKK